MAYQGLSVETDAAVGSAGIPTVARWLGADQVAAAGQRLQALASGSGAGQGGGSRTVLLPILRDVQGALKPVRERGLGCVLGLDAGVVWRRAGGALNLADLTPLCLPQGRLTLLLGPPSSGKSVFLRTIAGQLPPSKTVRVRGPAGRAGQSTRLHSQPVQAPTSRTAALPVLHASR